MTTKVDTNITAPEDRAAVKQAIAKFKATLTEQDLRRMHDEAFETNTHGEVLKCEISASSSNPSKMCFFEVNMIIKSQTRFYTLSFFINEICGKYYICATNLHEMRVYEPV